jgi:acetyl-CoA C-acetyltransferase
MTGRKVGIIGGARIPFARSNSLYKNTPTKELMTESLKALVKKYNLEGKELGMVSVGAVAKSSRDFSMARETAIDAGLSYSTPACDMQMACGTSLETTVHVANQIALGQIESGIAGGVDSSSVVPIELNQKFSNRLVQLSRARSIGEKLSLISGLRPNDIVPAFPALKEPRTGLSMGEHCELMVQDWKINRVDQDELALKSHQNASLAYENGFYKDLVFPFKGNEIDNTVRKATTLEKLSKLKPAFDKEKGTLTAGNSSPMTDGASCAFLCSDDYAKENNFEIEAYLTHYQAAAVDYKSKEVLLMAPAYAVPKLLKKAAVVDLFLSVQQVEWVLLPLLKGKIKIRYHLPL